MLKLERVVGGVGVWAEGLLESQADRMMATDRVASSVGTTWFDDRCIGMELEAISGV